MKKISFVIAIFLSISIMLSACSIANIYGEVNSQSSLTSSSQEESSSQNAVSSSEPNDSKSITKNLVRVDFFDGAAKKLFFDSEPITVEGLIIIGIYTDNEFDSIDISNCDVELPSSSQTGFYKIKVSFGEYFFSYDITVIKRPEVVNNEIKLIVNRYYEGLMSESDSNNYNQFKTIESALEVASTFDAQIIKTIMLTDGNYYEKLSIETPNIRLIGKNASKVKIYYDDCSSMVGGSDKSSSVFVHSSAYGFYAEKITFENSYNYLLGGYAEKQAIAITVDADMSVFEQCVFKGYQNTLQAKTGRQLYYGCEIYGATDYITGNNATALFENCLIVSRYTGSAIPNNAFITAHKGNNGTNGELIPKFGFVFKNCVLAAEQGLHDGVVALGRPWRADAVVAFLECYMGSHISKTGYNQGGLQVRYAGMSGGGNYNYPQNANFAEYKNRGEGAVTGLEYTGQLANDFKMLTAQQADEYSLANIFKAENGQVSYDSGNWTPFISEIIKQKKHPSEVDNAIIYKYTASPSLISDSIFSFGWSVVVDMSSVKTATIDGITSEFNYRIKLGSKFQLNADKGFIKIEAPSGGILTVVLMSSSSLDSVRTVDIFDRSGNCILTAENYAQTAGNILTAESGGIATFSIPYAGTYYLGSRVNSINIYHMEFRCN